MSILDTKLCEWPGCPSDAAPDALYCPRHAERFSRGELPPKRTCNAAGCLRDALEGTVFCAPCNRERLAVTELAALEGSPVLCHYDGCDTPALEATIGARRQGGRYEICQAHLDALNEKARDTRRRNAQEKAPRSVIAQHLTPPESENGGHLGFCALDTDHAGPCRDFAERDAQERAEQHITEIAPIATEPGAPDLPLIRQHAQGCMLEQSHDGECYVPGAPDGTPARWEGVGVTESAPVPPIKPRALPAPPWPGPVPEGPFPTELVGGWVTVEEDKIQLEERVLDAWGEALAAVYLAIGDECGKADGTITGARNLAALAAELLAQGATINRALAAVASTE